MELHPCAADGVSEAKFRRMQVQSLRGGNMLVGMLMLAGANACRGSGGRLRGPASSGDGPSGTSSGGATGSGDGPNRHSHNARCLRRR